MAGQWCYTNHLIRRFFLEKGNCLLHKTPEIR